VERREPLDRDPVLRPVGGALHADQVVERRHADHEPVEVLVCGRRVEVRETVGPGRRAQAVHRTRVGREREVVPGLECPALEQE
jgi:hypothetical protein